MYRTALALIVGVSPLYMHSSRLVDPLDPFAKEIKRLNPGAKKSEKIALQRDCVECFGGAYHTETKTDFIDDPGCRLGSDARLILPMHVIEAVIVAGAKKAKKGPAAKAGVVAEKDALLIYNGPKDINELFLNKNFVSRVSIRVGQNRVMRNRFVFRNWSAKIEFDYDDELLNEDDVKNALDAAGMYCGVGDWKPRNGRFTVAEFEVVSAAKAA